MRKQIERTWISSRALLSDLANPGQNTRGISKAMERLLATRRAALREGFGGVMNERWRLHEKEEGSQVLRIKKGHVHLQGMKKQCMDSWRKAQHKRTPKRQEFWELRCLSK